MDWIRLRFLVFGPTRRTHIFTGLAESFSNNTKIDDGSIDPFDTT